MRNSIFLLITFAVLAGCNQQKVTKLRENMKINEGWKMAKAGDSEWIDAKVPGSVHIDLLDNGKIKDPFYRTNEKDLQWIDKEDWVYKTTFNVSATILSMEVVEMKFYGLDTYADVKINGEQVLSADNMFREWTVDCKNLLKEGANEIEIFFHSPTKKGLEELDKFGYALPASNDQSENGGLGDKKVSIFTRKAPYHYGWDWGPRFVTSGIWRPIELIAWNKAKLQDLQIIQNEFSENSVALTAKAEIQSKMDGKAIVRIFNEENGNQLAENEIELKTGENEVSVDFKINDPKLWWTNGLGEQNLYTIRAEIDIDGSKTDISDRIGLRTLKLIREKDSDGEGTSFYFELNGRPVFMKGANHIPNDNFLSRVTKEIYEREINDAANANMNMLRVWGGGIYEDDVFYDLCDEKGILVWQDFMFACSMYPGDDKFLKNVEQEAIDNVKRLRNHPSVALWCGNNEIDAAWAQHEENRGWGWKQRYNDEQRTQIWTAYENIFMKTLSDVVEKYDPDRAYWHSSPTAEGDKHAGHENKSGDMHYWGVWHGKEPFSRFQEIRSRFMSEYGFQSFPDLETVKKYALPEEWDIESEVMAAHQRSGIGNLRIREYMGWYYNIPTDFEHFLYVGQILQAEGIKSAIEAHRRDMPFCMGTLYWQMNDCWPVASWSGIDYFGRWKALHYFVKKSFENIIISPSFFGTDSIKIFVVSDMGENTNAQIELKLTDFKGEEKWSKTIDADIEGNTSKTYATLLFEELQKVADAKNTVLTMQVKSGDKILASNIAHLVPVRSLKLPKPTIEKTITKNDKGYTISLKSDVLAKYIYLTIPDTNGFFSDNYFDILPGQTVEIEFITSESLENIDNKLKITTLTDTY